MCIIINIIIIILTYFIYLFFKLIYLLFLNAVECFLLKDEKIIADVDTY